MGTVSSKIPDQSDNDDVSEQPQAKEYMKYTTRRTQSEALGSVARSAHETAKFSRHTLRFSTMRITLTGRAVFHAMLMLSIALLSPSDLLGQVTITTTGTVTSGTDGLGLFGKVGADLTGLAVRGESQKTVPIENV
jgi:hypothetical protein